MSDAKVPVAARFSPHIIAELDRRVAEQAADDPTAKVSRSSLIHDLVVAGLGVSAEYVGGEHRWTADVHLGQRCANCGLTQAAAGRWCEPVR